MIINNYPPPGKKPTDTLQLGNLDHDYFFKNNHNMSKVS